MKYLFCDSNMKSILVICLFFFFSGCNKDNSYVEKIYDGHVELNSQMQLDSFGSLGYTNVTGNLIIGNYLSPNNSITNLDALQDLRSASHLIINYNNALESIEGLANLNELSAQLIISDNPQLTHLDGLEKLTHVGAILEISHNASLEQIDGLSGLESIGEGSGNLKIWGNSQLKNLDGLTKLKKGGWMYIYNNPSLENIEGLCKVKEGLYLYLANNSNLTTVKGLRRLEKLQYELEIVNNSSLSDFCGVKKLLKSDPLSNEQYHVSGNANNPTQEEIVDGKCD